MAIKKLKHLQVGDYFMSDLTFCQLVKIVDNEYSVKTIDVTSSGEEITGIHTTDNLDLEVHTF